MKRKTNRLNLFQRIDRPLSRLRKQERPLYLEPFRGFTNGETAFFQGRLLEYKPLFDQWKSSWRRNLVNSFRRFASEEVPGALVEVRFGENQIPLITDKEGYFILDSALPNPITENGMGWMDARVFLKQAPGRIPQEVSRKGQLLLPDQNVSLGLITDIDDTLLHTGVTSPMKWRVFYLTFLMSISARKPVQASGHFYRNWHRIQSPGRPVFYVSNSPWNLYDLLRDFLRFNGFPKGPILLRDVGLPYRDYPEEFPSHKEYTIARIMEIYPKMRFICIGDSGEKDAKIYLHIAKNFPNQMAAILIRKVGSKRRSNRIQALLNEQAGHIPSLLFSEYEEVSPFLSEYGLW